MYIKDGYLLGNVAQDTDDPPVCKKLSVWASVEPV